MKKTILFVLMFVGFALACPFSVNCQIDGMAMHQTVCNYNYQTRKQVCRFEHQHFENGQSVTHYQYVQCD